MVSREQVAGNEDELETGHEADNGCDNMEYEKELVGTVADAL